MLEGRFVWVEVRPEVVLEVLADLEDHDTMERDGLAPAALHAELGGVDLLYKFGIEGGGERILGGAGVPKLEDTGAVDLRHDWCPRGLGFGWEVVGTW